MIRNIKRQNLPFFVLVFIAAILAWLNSPGIFFGDEFVYAQKSIDLASGDYFNSGHHFDNRFGLLLPTALIVHILGTHYSVFFLLPFLSFVFILYSTRKTLNFIHPDFSRMSVLLILLNTGFAALAGDVSVDLLMAACLTGAMLLTWLVRTGHFSSMHGGLIVSFSLFYAVFTKMTAIFCFPFFGILFLIDLKNKKFIQFWLTILASSIVLYVLYFTAYYVYTGDIFFRFRGLEQTHGDGDIVPWNYRNRPLIDIIERITVYPIAFFLFAPGYGAVMILGIFSIFYHKLLNRKGFGRFISWYFILAVFGFWFGSSSLSQYNPVVLVERMLAPILPPASILTAYLFFENKINIPSKNFIAITRILALIGILFALFLAYIRPDKGLGLTYSIFILLGLVWLVDKQIRPKHLFLVLVLFLIHHIYRIFFLVPEISFYTERQFYQELEARKEKMIILTDARTAEMYTAYFDFRKPKYLMVMEWNKEWEEEDYTKIILHKNTRRQGVLDVNKIPSTPSPLVSNIPKKEIFHKNEVYFYELKRK